MKLNNYQILEFANLLFNAFNTQGDLYIPAKANYFIHKNMQLLNQSAEVIEQARLNVAQHYGDLAENEQQYIIPQDKIQEAHREIQDLFSIEQELDIKTIKIEDLGNLQLSTAQMKALMFMIED